MRQIVCITETTISGCSKPSDDNSLPKGSPGRKYGMRLALSHEVGSHYFRVPWAAA